MDVLMIADFCGQFQGIDNNRFIYIANMLSKKHSIEIVSSNFNHEKKQYFEKIKEDVPFKITLLHEPKYKKNICLKRFQAHYVWGKNVGHYLERRSKPDVVYCAVPTLKAAYEAAKYCERNKIRFIIDIQDLWPEAFKMVFKVPVLSDIFFSPFSVIANEIYKRADDVVAVSETYVARAEKVNHKRESSRAVYLGTDLALFDKNKQTSNYSAGKQENEIWIGYCGSLEKSYDLITVIDAIQIAKEEIRQKIVFVVMGDGSRLDEFRNHAFEKNVEAKFCGRLSYDDMCKVLFECDIVVNPIVSGSAASIINKVGDYAASGKPVINTQESEEYRSLVDGYQMGYNCDNNDANQMAEAIIRLVRDKKKSECMGNNARRCAEERFDRERTYQRILELFVMGDA